MKIDLSDKRRLTKIIVSAVMGVLILLTLFWQSKSVYTNSTFYYPTEQFVELQSGQPVELNVLIDSDDPVLRSVAVTFATYARVNEGDVKVEFVEGDTVLSEWHVSASELLDNAIRGFEADHTVRLNKGSVYKIRITEQFEGDNSIAVGAASTGNLSCYVTTYDSGRCLKWFAVMALIFIAAFAVSSIWGGLLDMSVVKIVVSGIAVMFVLFIFQFDLFPAIATRLSVKPVPSATEVWDTVGPEATADYTFSYNGEPFEGLEIFTTGENASEYLVTLVNNTTGTTYFDNTAVSHDWRVTTGRLCMLLRTKDSSSGLRYYENGEYSLTITNTSPEKSLQVELASNPEESGVREISFAGIRDTDLGRKVATMVIGLMIVYLVAIDILRKRGKLNVEVFFLVTVLPLSFVYFIFMQPWNVPDSGAHFLASYRVSNLLLGVNGDREWFARTCDTAYYNGISWWTEKKPDLAGIASMVQGLRTSAGDTTLADLIPHEVKMEYYSVINWLPQGLGLALGRLLGLGSAIAVILARVFILAAYVLGCLRAIRNAPVGKSLFAALALLPVSLMMSSSFSYDAMVIIVSLNFVAIFLKLRSEITRASVIEAVVWAFLLGSVKGGCGLFLLPLMLLLIKKDKKSILTATGIIAAALLSVLLFDKILPSDELFQFGEENSGTMMTQFAFDNPAQYLRMVVKTFFLYSDHYLTEAFGMYLSYLEEVFVLVTVFGSVLAAFVYSTFEKDTLELKKSDRIAFVVIFVLSLLITPAMLLSYTPSGSGVIYGIQGRYFFPVIILILMSITKFGLHKSREGADEKTRAAAIRTCTNVYVIMTLVMVYMLVKLYLGR
ncbi:MAG: DUF2142 domain-containing protein [Clostridiales bacterium]|nr:DUF2142 domain-containing protein [Clostridiales bacterium]